MTEHKDRRHKQAEMYKMYGEYKESLKIAKKTLLKRQKMNAEIRERYENPYQREDHQRNVVDITHWNEMIRDLEEDMKCMEMYLDFDDRVLLNKEYESMRRMIYDPKSYEGLVPMESAYGETCRDTTEIVTDIELQEEIVELLEDVLTERQKQVICMYFWEGMTQEQIGKKLGIAQKNVSTNLQNSLDTLKKCINYDEILEILRD